MIDNITFFKKIGEKRNYY